MVAGPKLFVTTGLIVALSLVLAGCGGGASGQEGGEPVSGEIRIEGSSTVYPITQAAAELFREENPDARIEVGGAGTSDGFEAFCQGDTQISDASRPIEAEEIEACKEAGVEYIEIPIAYDGISVVVNKKGNDWATEITSEELKMIWEPSAEGQVTEWSQVDPGWPDRPLDLYRPGGVGDLGVALAEGLEAVAGPRAADLDARIRVLLPEELRRCLSDRIYGA